MPSRVQFLTVDEADETLLVCDMDQLKVRCLPLTEIHAYLDEVEVEVRVRSDILKLILCSRRLEISRAPPPLPRLQVVDLFCGVGGFSAGAMRAGGSPVLGLDRMSALVKLWSHNTGAEGRCADFWADPGTYAATGEGYHVHLSPPCTNLSRANTGATQVSTSQGEDELERCLRFGLSLKSSWSLETVSTPRTRRAVEAVRLKHPGIFSWTHVNAADYGVPSTRERIIAGRPSLVQRLREMPSRRVSLEDAFATAGLPIVAGYIRNNSKTVQGAYCPRPVSSQCHTQTASHPLVWCDARGTTVRCLSVEETAVVQGFPAGWTLPRTSREAIAALGNAVPPPLAAAVVLAAHHASDAEQPGARDTRASPCPPTRSQVRLDGMEHVPIAAEPVIPGMADAEPAPSTAKPVRGLRR